MIKPLKNSKSKPRSKLKTVDPLGTLASNLRRYQAVKNKLPELKLTRAQVAESLEKLAQFAKIARHPSRELQKYFIRKSLQARRRARNANIQK